MAQNASAAVAVEWGQLRARPSRWVRLMRVARAKPLGTFSVLLLAGLIFMAIAADLIAPYSPYEMRVGLAFQAPSGEFFLGTDQVGRDVLSRVIHGSRISLMVGILTVLLAAVLGAAIGLTSGYLGGKYDLWVQRVMDVFQAFPMIIMALVIVAVLGASSTNVIVAIAIPMVPKLSRVVRAATMSIKESAYVTAAEAAGCTQGRILLQHVLPNTFAPLVIMGSLLLGTAIIVEASLSYLGLGAQEPTPSWGLMLAGSAATYAERSPWIPVFPGLALSLAVFAVNTLGDTVRDVLDPRLRGT